MGWESSDVVRLDFRSLLQGQMRIPKLKSTYNSRIISPRRLQCENQLVGNHWLGILMWSDLTFDPLLQGQMRIAKNKSAYNLLIMIESLHQLSAVHFVSC